MRTNLTSLGDEFTQKYNVSQAAVSYYSAQASLSFFYAVVTICKMVDLFYGTMLHLG